MTGPRSTTFDPVDVVALGHVLAHAKQVGLPMPVDVLLGDSVRTLGGPAVVRLDMAGLSDLTEWAIYLEACVETESLTPRVDHYSIEGEVLELPVRLIATVTYERTVLELIEDIGQDDPVPFVVDESGAWS